MSEGNCDFKLFIILIRLVIAYEENDTSMINCDAIIWPFSSIASNPGTSPSLYEKYVSYKYKKTSLGLDKRTKHDVPDVHYSEKFVGVPIVSGVFWRIQKIWTRVRLFFSSSLSLVLGAIRSTALKITRQKQKQAKQQG